MTALIKPTCNHSSFKKMHGPWGYYFLQCYVCGARGPKIRMYNDNAH